MSHKILFASLILIFAACSSEPEMEEQKTEQKEVVVLDVTAEGIPFTRDTLNYSGYIGDAAVTVQLIQFNTDQEINFLDSVYGTYSYDAHKKDINLTGVFGCEDWCEMNLTEMHKGKVTGVWALKMKDNKNELSGTWNDPVTKKKEFILLKNILSDSYLDPKAKAIFVSKKASQTFFKKHQVFNNDMRNKRFYVLSNPNPANGPSSFDGDKQYEHPLPAGLKLHFDWEQVYDETEAVITKDRRIKGKNGLNIPIDSLFTVQTEIGYEVPTYIFNAVSPTEISVGKYDGNGFTINIADLENLGYHLVDELQWMIDHTESVFGYFPTYETFITIHQKPDAKSKSILKVDPDSLDGHILLRDAKLIDNEWWGQIDYEYYDEIPCSSDKMIPLPTVKGWIKLYDDKGNAVLDHYSRGC